MLRLTLNQTRLAVAPDDRGEGGGAAVPDDAIRRRATAPAGGAGRGDVVGLDAEREPIARRQSHACRHRADHRCDGTL